MTRLDRDEYFIEIAKLVARRATCSRRQVGCVLVNSHNHILATGYNGVASGRTHCTDEPCAGANAPSGTSLHLCEAIHAEANALMQCRNISEISTAYVTASPCVSCLRLLLNTSCFRIVFAEEYPHPESKAMWIDANRVWDHFVPYTASRPTIKLTPISEPAVDLVQIQFHLPGTVVQDLNGVGTDRLLQALKDTCIRLSQGR